MCPLWLRRCWCWKWALNYSCAVLFMGINPESFLCVVLNPMAWWVFGSDSVHCCTKLQPLVEPRGIELMLQALSGWYLGVSSAFLTVKLMHSTVAIWKKGTFWLFLFHALFSDSGFSALAPLAVDGREMILYVITCHNRTLVLTNHTTWQWTIQSLNGREPLKGFLRVCIIKPLSMSVCANFLCWAQVPLVVLQCLSMAWILQKSVVELEGGDCAENMNWCCSMSMEKHKSVLVACGRVEYACPFLPGNPLNLNLCWLWLLFWLLCSAERVVWGWVLRVGDGARQALNMASAAIRGSLTQHPHLL